MIGKLFSRVGFQDNNYSAIIESPKNKVAQDWPCFHDLSVGLVNTVGTIKYVFKVTSLNLFQN